ncbi:MAG: 3-oxoacyl-[acyl-carrier-protein] synthase III C-terminal domain-containing protein [Polyangiaceae bacterium]
MTNQELIERGGHRLADHAVAKIFGTENRRVAGQGVVDSDLLAQAAEACLARAGIGVDNLSKLIVTKFLGDHVLPMTAAHLQRRLAASVAMQSLDVDGGVHGFFNALEAAIGSISCGDGPILIVSGGVIHRMISGTDPRSAFLFGDGAAAVLVGPSSVQQFHATYGFSNSEFIDDARGFSLRDCTRSDDPRVKSHEKLYDLYSPFDYKRCLPFVLEGMEKTVESLLQTAGVTRDRVGLFLLTENHGRMWSAILERLQIPEEKTVSLLSRYGNTMSAMLPLLLDEAIRTGRAREGMVVMLLSVGEGITGGGALLTI